MKKVALISTYCDTQEKIEVLDRNIDNLKICGLDVIVISPLLLPEKIQKKCDYYFYMKDNPVIEYPEKVMYAWKILTLGGEKIQITKTYLDYSWAGLYQVKKLSEIGLLFDYDYFYHIIYDLKFDETVVRALLSESECDVYSSKGGGNVWIVGLHLMCFNREKLQNFIPHITLESYLNGSNVVDAFGWLHKLNEVFPYNIKEKPVEDEISYYGRKDFLNSSPVDNFKFFIEKNYDEDNTIKLLFYEIIDAITITIIIGEKKYDYEVSGNALIDLGVDKKNIPKVSIRYNNIDYDITKTIEKIKHSTLKVLK
jgi:hypothetical protein